jgi:hypothetical protein
MRALLMFALVVVLVGCTNYNKFTPSTDATYEPRPADFPIEFYPDTEPDTLFVVVGFAEARGNTVEHALPLLKKLARLHGGNALINLKTTHVMALAFNYSATIVRYK